MENVVYLVLTEAEAKKLQKFLEPTGQFVDILNKLEEEIAELEAAKTTSK